MIRFAALLANGPVTPDAFAAYAAQVGATEAATARALLTGTRPKRIASPQTLLDWVVEVTQTPAFLTLACLAVTPDKAEVAALLLPAPPPHRAEVAPPLPLAKTDPAPTLSEVLALCTDRDSYLRLAQSLPPPTRLILNRIATGTFRTKLPAAPETAQNPGTCRAILTMIDPAGPEATFAVPQGNSLVPLCKLRLTLPETAELLSWAKSHTTDRFGPLRQVTAELVFEIAYTGTHPNPRRKCGFELIGASLIQWHREATPDRATRLDELKALPPSPD